MFASSKFLNFAINGVRITLGIVFLWFGLLKISGNNPVYDIVNASFPFLASGIGNYVLAIFESLIGIGLMIKKFPWVVHWSLIFHLLGTFTVFILAPEIMFDPYFPFLTLAGEFVVKNLVLAMGGLILLWSRPSQE